MSNLRRSSAPDDLSTYMSAQIALLPIQPSQWIVALHYQDADHIFPSAGDVADDTVFGIGSVTKVFTTTLLASQCTGPSPRRQLGDTVAQYLPDVAAGSALHDVTLLQLATHTSSLPRAGGGPGGENLFADRAPSDELISFWNQWKPTEDPGTCWCYSNVGFVTLGYAVSGVGTPPTAFEYLTELADTITGASQLDMPATTTYANEDPTKVAPGFDAKGHQATTPATDLYSSAADILTWLKANLNAAAGSSALDTALTLTHTATGASNTICPTCRSGAQSVTNFSMGLAWQISEESPPIWAKDGAAGGYSCWIGFMPSAAIGLAILTNRDGANPGHFGPTIIRTLSSR